MSTSVPEPAVPRSVAPEGTAGEAGGPSRTAPASAALERFARDTLGCHCPAEVFERVADDREPLPGLPEVRRRIAVGERLLIYVVAPPARPGGADRILARIGRWVAAGRAERDRRGMNRLRIALVLDAPDPATVAAIEAVFARLPELAGAPEDPRIHLHCLPPDVLVGL